MTDLERVARAIFCAIWTPEMWDDKGFEIERQESFAEARAAIEALMEPGGVVLGRGAKALARQPYENDFALAYRIHQAMLRAVLEGE